MITEFINRYGHWLLLLITGLSMGMGFTIFTSSAQGVIAGIFGIVGFLGVTYLVILMEGQKRKKSK
ncbi:hypothetical protein LCD52_05775 [Rossellomorea vietnamensis]|uniref:hypothetical protein n=1 Tax=Rossellomorea vietnamensis TaxID=218284 RepID=UPI001CCD09AB|nr:hypothetical protein [Rossellomorea vietnamensis]MCA0148300.1 hypothetical protein [Rossellomorea vietnamensis]